jgi:hypothetical protein
MVPHPTLLGGPVALCMSQVPWSIAYNLDTEARLDQLRRVP